MTLRTPSTHHHTITISYRLGGIGITKSYSMIDEPGWGVGNVWYYKREARGGGEVLNECRGLGGVIIPTPHPK